MSQKDKRRKIVIMFGGPTKEGGVRGRKRNILTEKTEKAKF